MIQIVSELFEGAYPFDRSQSVASFLNFGGSLMKSINGFDKLKNMAGRTRVASWRMNVKINVIQHPVKKGLLHIGLSHQP